MATELLEKPHDISVDELEQQFNMPAYEPVVSIRGLRKFRHWVKEHKAKALPETIEPSLEPEEQIEQVETTEDPKSDFYRQFEDMLGYGRSTVEKYRENIVDVEDRRQLFSRNTIITDFKSELAQKILGLVNSAELISPVEAKSDRTDEEKEEYLDSRLIKNTEFLGRASNRSGYGVNIKADKDKPIDVPLGLVVNVQGFESWLGRGSRGSEVMDRRLDIDGTSHAKRVQMTSFDLIKHYAGLKTQIPPVGEMRIFVQPDGKVIADNGSGDSHRLAAAVLKGQPSIPAESVQVYLLKENFI